MNYKCNNCGGSMVYSPEKQRMYCPFCEQVDCESIIGNTSVTHCASCGAELDFGPFVCSSQCPYCDSYVILDDRVSHQFQPNIIIPFQIGKKDALSKIDEHFKKRTFAPISFLNSKASKDMQGRYVPFFLYDYSVHQQYQGTCTTTRHWRSGDFDYTETSYYEVERDMYADYNQIPVDASNEMPDTTMDLLEPYDYQRLMQFDPKYLSGFFGEIYNMTADQYEMRARKKAVDSASTLLKQSVTGYTSMNPPIAKAFVEIAEFDVKYALFPVWVYHFKWGKKNYPVYVNGQTGKVVGKSPVSKWKVVLYGITVGILNCAIFIMIVIMMGEVL